MSKSIELYSSELLSLAWWAPTDELQWIAGFMDGEGCFKGQRKTDCVHIAARVSVGQRWDNQEVLDKIAAAFGGHVRPKSLAAARRLGIGSQDAVVWEVGGNRARAVAALLWPYLGSAKRADIQEWGLPNPRYGKPTGRRAATKRMVAA